MIKTIKQSYTIEITIFDKKTNLKTCNKTTKLINKLIKRGRIIKISKSYKIKTNKKKRVQMKKTC